jgi:sulfatase modifying factor 1
MNRRLLVAALLAAAIAAVAVGAGCELILPPGELNSVDAVAPDGDAQPQRCPLTVKPMQSCLGDAGTICGPEGDASCCLSLPVEGGTFTRSGYRLPDGGIDRTVEGGLAVVGDFYLDAFEVTVGRFKRFASEPCITPEPEAGATPGIPGSGWNSTEFRIEPDGERMAEAVVVGACNSLCNTTPLRTITIDGGEALPINCITWEEALAFCIWDGARLPTEAEWNYAAAGGSEQRYYPWSAPASSRVIEPSLAVYNANAPERVGSKPSGQGRWQQFDLAGNVGEFVLDYYATPFIPCDPGPCAELSPGNSAMPIRISRGGVYTEQVQNLTTFDRTEGNGMNQRAEARGFRCARDSL